MARIGRDYCACAPVWGFLLSPRGLRCCPPDASSREHLRAFVRNEAWGHRASCSCAIGPDRDPRAVLNGDFRVRGVSGLRVVDASVFPRIPGTFLASAVCMISEKAIDVLIGAHAPAA